MSSAAARATFAAVAAVVGPLVMFALYGFGAAALSLTFTAAVALALAAAIDSDRTRP